MWGRRTKCYCAEGANSSGNLQFAVETMETRCLLSGVVSLAVRGSVLYVDGDNNSNAFTIESRFGTLEVTGQNGTVIDTSDPSYFAQRNDVRSFRIDTGNGDDSVTIKNISPATPQGYLRLFVNDGKNKVEVDTCRFTSVTINSGTGEDNILIDQTQIGDKRGNLTIQNGDGFSIYRISSGVGIGRSIHGNVNISAGDGGHQVWMDGVRVRDGIVNIRSENFSIVGITGCDRIRTVRVTDRTTAPGMGHSLIVDNSEITGTITTNYPGGSSTLSLIHGTRVGKTITFSTGDGYSHCYVHDSYAQGNLNIRAAGTVSASIATSTLGRALTMTTTGNGTTEVRTQNSTIKGAMTLTNRGPGTDSLALSATTVDGNLTVRNSDGGSSTVLNGASVLRGSLSVTNRKGADVLILDGITVQGPIRIDQGDGGSWNLIQGLHNPIASFRYQSRAENDTLLMYDVAVAGTAFIRTGDGADAVVLETDGPSASIYRKSVWILTEAGTDVVFLGGDTLSTAVAFQGRVITDGGADDDGLYVGNFATFLVLPTVVRNFEVIDGPI